MSITRSLPAWSLGVQGALVILPGIYGLLRPTDFITQGLDVSPAALRGLTVHPLAHASGMQLITMGTYFCLAAQHPSMHRIAAATNIPLRVLAACVFWQDGPRMRSVALWELLWAGWNGAMLYITWNQ